MKSVDEPESPSFSPDGRTIAFSALRGGIGDIFTVNLETQEIVNLTTDDFSDYGPTYSPDGKLHRLQRARQREPEAVPARSRHEEEDAAHLRHPRRDGRAVHRRQHAGVLVDGDQPEPAARSGSGQERQHLQRLDARPEERRAEAVHRHARRHPVADRAERRRRQQVRLRHLLQGRLRHPHARARRSRCTPRRAPTSARPARSSTSRRRSSTRWSPPNQRRKKAVREDVPRGPAAGERRRHQQRRRVRRHGDQLRRRARRQAVQRLRRVDLAVPHACRSAT